MAKLQQTRQDGWRNVGTRLGMPTHDKTLRAAFDVILVVSDPELSAMYHYDPVSRKICTKPGDEALREGITVTLDEGDDDALETATAIMSALDELGAVPKMAETSALDRAFGGAVLWIGTDDNADLAEPPGTYSKVTFVRPMDRRYLEPKTMDDDTSSPGFGSPLTYMVIKTVDGRRQEVREIHRDRLVIFRGLPVTDDERERRNSWGMPVLQLVYESLQRNAQAWQAAGYTFLDRGYSTFKVHNLLDLLEREGGRAALEQRAEAVEMVRSVARAQIIGEGEEWTVGDLDFGTMPEMLGEFMHDLSNAVDIPVTVLFGRSPAGQNATGESDLELWYNHVRAIQTHVLRFKFEQLVTAIMRGTDGPTSGQVLEDWSVEFPPLRQLSPLEEADRRLKTSQADASDVQNEILLPEEVAKNRYRPEGYSTETTIDLDAREQILEAEMQRAIEEAENPPEPPPMPPNGMPPNGVPPVPDNDTMPPDDEAVA